MTNLLLSVLSTLTAFAAAPFHYIEVEGSINPGSSSHITEAIKAAEAEGGQGLILQLNTPGGLLSSTRDIIKGINSSSVPVIVYVAPGGASATSAGALIALSSHVAAMAPGTNMGAAHPVGQGGEEVKGPMGDKVTNDTAALARSQATQRGRNAEAAEQIVRKSESFSPEEAVKKKVVEIVASDLDGLLKALHGRTVTVENPQRRVTLDTAGAAATSLVKKEMNLRQKFLHLIADPNISALLIALGGLAIYAEISSGFSTLIPGVFGLFCLLLGFVSLQTLPVNVGGALLFALGFGLLVAEAFVTSYGLLTAAALTAIFLGGLFLVDPATTDMRVSLSLLIPMVGGTAVVLAAVAYMFYRERRSGGLPEEKGDQVVGTVAKVAQITGTGIEGTAYANGELWSFDSDEPLQPGDEAIVASLRGMRIQLRRRK
jgi:membrane-bound serine protease (ClpP class)